MSYPPNAYLGPSAQIIPTDTPTTTVSSPPSTTELQHILATAPLDQHAGSPSISPTAQPTARDMQTHQLHARIQKLRNSPFEPSPLASLVQTSDGAAGELSRGGSQDQQVTFEEAECEGMRGLDGEGSLEAEVEDDEWIDEALPDSAMSEDNATYVDLPLTEYPPRRGSPTLRTIRLRIRPAPSPPSSAAHPPRPFISPGSNRTKIIIRRPFGANSPKSSSSPPAEMDSEGDTEMGSDDDQSTPRRLPTPLSVSLKLRDRSHKAERRARGSLTIGGRIKWYDETNARLSAILRAWEEGLMSRWDPLEAYRIMERPLPALGSPPEFCTSTWESSAKGDSPSSHQGNKAYKRLRYSPEAARREMEGIGTDGGKRKKGRNYLLEMDSVPMTRMPSPEFGLMDFGGASGASDDFHDGSQFFKEAHGIPTSTTSLSAISEEIFPIAIPVGTPTISARRLDDPFNIGRNTSPRSTSDSGPSSVTAVRYSVGPRNGRRTISPLELNRPLSPETPQRLQSHFSPPSPIEADIPPWEIAHIEHNDNHSVPPSPTGPEIQPLGYLGLDLGDPYGDVEMPDGTFTPRHHDELIEESQRQQLCAAIEVLAAQHPVRSFNADWTPPMREFGIDDTPTSVADELITTPELDMADLPASSVAGELETSPGEESDVEDMPRPRLDKGKGRARPDDYPSGDREPSLYVSTDGASRPRYNEPMTQRTMAEEDGEAILDSLVMEVSRLEAQQLELDKEERHYEDPEVVMLERRIEYLNRQISQISQSFGFPDQSNMSPIGVDQIDSDEDLAIRLQLEYEREDAMYDEDQRRLVSIQRPRPIGGVRTTRYRTEPPLPFIRPIDTDVDDAIPRLARRCLTFGSDEGTEGHQPSGRGSVSDLLDRSSIFTGDGPFERSTMLDGIRLRNRAASSTWPHQPIIPPQLYPLPRDKVHIVITPPTPIVSLRQPDEWVERTSVLADPLEMGGHGPEAMVDVQEVEEGDENMSDSEGSDETIRPKKSFVLYDTPDWGHQLERDVDRAPLTRRLSEPFDTPSVGIRPYLRRLSADDVSTGESPTARRSALDIERPARVLFDSPKGQGGIEFESDAKVRVISESIYDQTWSPSKGVEITNDFDITQRHPIRTSLDVAFRSVFRFSQLSPDSTETSPRFDKDYPSPEFLLLNEDPASASHSPSNLDSLPPMTWCHSSPRSPRSPKTPTAPSRALSPPVLPDYDSALFGESEPWLPGELAERLRWEVAIIRRRHRSMRRRRMRRVLIMAGRLGVVVLACWICSGFFGILVDVAE